MKLFEIKKAGDGQHKYKAVFCACDGPESRCCAVQKKIILFGAEGYKDYIQYYKNDPAKAEMKKMLNIVLKTKKKLLKNLL